MQSPKRKFVQTYLAENPKQFSKHGLELALVHLEDERQLYVVFETASVMYDNLSTFTEVNYVEFFDKKRHDGSFSEDILDYNNKDITDTEIRFVVKQHLKSQNAFVGFTHNNTVVYNTFKSPRALFVKTFLANHNPECEFSEEGLHILVKYFDEDEDGAAPENNTDEVLARRISGWYCEKPYETFFFNEVAKRNITPEHPCLFDHEFDAVIKSAVQRALESKRFSVDCAINCFIGFTTKDTVVYKAIYHQD